MKNVKLFAISALVTVFISYVLVIIFLMFGPVYVNGELAIRQSGLWTMLLSLVVFWPVLFLFRRRAARKDQ